MYLVLKKCPYTVQLIFLNFMQALFPLLLLFSLSFLSIYYPPFLGYINIYQNIPIWLEKVRHSRKITADGRRQIPIWLEKVRHGWKITADTRGKRLKIFPYGWKKSDMVGKLQWMEGDMVGNFPQGARKSVPSHRTFSLVHPSYRREFPILFSISMFIYMFTTLQR